MAEQQAAAADPVDAEVVKKILETMGVVKYESRVVYQLLEFIHRK